MRGIKDITGMRSGMLEAIRPTNKRAKNGGAIWICKCDCGKVTEVAGNSIVQQKTKSCGCNKSKPKSKQRGKYEPWDECFAWNSAKGKCDCLRETLCIKIGTCNFFAPKEEVGEA